MLPYYEGREWELIDKLAINAKIGREEAYRLFLASSSLPAKPFKQKISLRELSAGSVEVAELLKYIPTKPRVFSSVEDKIDFLSRVLPPKKDREEGVFEHCVQMDAKKKRFVVTDGLLLFVMPDVSITESRLINPEYLPELVDYTPEKIKSYPDADIAIPKENGFNRVSKSVSIRPLLFSLWGVEKSNYFLDNPLRFKLMMGKSSYVLDAELLLKAVKMLQILGDKELTVSMDSHSDMPKPVTIRGVQSNSLVVIMSPLSRNMYYYFKEYTL